MEIQVIEKTNERINRVTGSFGVEVNREEDGTFVLIETQVPDRFKEKNNSYER